MSLVSKIAKPPAVDLDAYCRRIGYHGPRTASLATLCALITRHLASIPFEAIDVMLGVGVNLEAHAVDAKLIHGRRGGYCFEHNSLFRRVLQTMGFQVEGLVARVRWGLPLDAAPTPRSHMALKVMAESEAWLVDVGFGACVPTSPLKLHSRARQRTPLECFRLTTHGQVHHLEVSLGDDWRPVYHFTEAPQLDADYAVHNWYTSTHPQSLFRQRLIAARVTPEARYTLNGAQLSVRNSDNHVSRQTLDADGLTQALAEIFGLTVLPAWRPLIERTARTARTAECAQVSTIARCPA